MNDAKKEYLKLKYNNYLAAYQAKRSSFYTAVISIMSGWLIFLIFLIQNEWLVNSIEWIPKTIWEKYQAQSWYDFFYVFSTVFFLFGIPLLFIYFLALPLRKSAFMNIDWAKNIEDVFEKELDPDEVKKIKKKIYRERT